MNEIISTIGIVLSKVDYSESSVIATVFTDECGLVKFIIKGDRRLSKKHLPKVDVLRTLYFTFTHREKNELQMPSSIESVGGYESVAANYQSYCCAAWICRFLSRNLHPFHPVPELNPIVSKSFELLCDAKNKSEQVFILAGFVIAFLQVEGLLPEAYLTQTAPQLQKFYNLVCSKQGQFSELSDDDSATLLHWCSEALRSNHLNDCSLGSLVL